MDATIQAKIDTWLSGNFDEATKAEIKKLLTLFLVDNKKAFKGNVTVLKECFNRICNMALPPSELALPHLFSTNLEDKKGIFSIL